MEWGRGGTRPYRGLRSSSNEGGHGIYCSVVEVDFFDEADGELIIGKIDVLSHVDARSAVLAHPPEGHGAEDGDRAGQAKCPQPQRRLHRRESTWARAALGLQRGCISLWNSW